MHLTKMNIRNLINDSITIKQTIMQDSAFLTTLLEIADVATQALERGNKLLFAGNGGSAGDAQHLAAELVGRYQLERPGVPALALTTDTSMLTAIANDYGYEHIFARQIQAQAQAGDVFIGISTSGNSKNILAAIAQAKASKVITVGFTGKGGSMLKLCDYCLAVPSTVTARIQETHIMLGHILCNYIEQALFGN